ncbi:hypothetical protein GCM10020358_09860 [Amorphoplanes nipponensis]
MEKSRTCSSEICIRAGATAGGLTRPAQPGGWSAGSSRSTSWLWVESTDSDSEYGSVTELVTTRCAAGCHTSTR